MVALRRMLGRGVGGDRSRKPPPLAPDRESPARVPMPIATFAVLFREAKKNVLYAVEYFVAGTNCENEESVVRRGCAHGRFGSAWKNTHGHALAS